MGKGAAGAVVIQRLRWARAARGWSQADLARASGITRQAVNAIERSRYVPNAAVALQLAAALEVHVEDLFVLGGPAVAQPVQTASDGLSTGSRVTVGVIRDRLVAHALDTPGRKLEGLGVADGVVHSAARRRRTKLDVRFLVPRARIDATAVLMGCDPSLDILATHVFGRRDGSRVTCIQASSRRALDAVKRGEAHIAGSHLWDATARDFNRGHARRALRRYGGLLVCLATWEMGLAVAADNPKSIRRIDDLARPDVRAVNREEGAGARELLDRLLASAGIPSDAVNGFTDVARTHAAIARAVAAGAADAGVTLRAVAVAHGLDFVPLAEVRFDLAIPSDQTGHAAVRAVLESLNDGRFRAQLDALPGYGTSRSGEVVLRIGTGSTAKDAR